MRRAAAIAAIVGCLSQPAWAAGDQSGIIRWQAFFQQLLSSFKVDSAQTSTASQQISATDKASSESKISSVLQNRINMEMAEAKERFSYETGQGYSMCMVSVGMADIKKAGEEREAYTRAIGERDSSWLAAGGGSGNDTLSSMVNLRQTVYCSKEEQASLGDYCTKEYKGYEAGNSNAMVFLGARGFGGEEAMTAFDYVDTVAPLPTVPTIAEGKSRTDLALDRASAIRKGLLLNGARTSLQNIILDGMSGTSAQE